MTVTRPSHEHRVTDPVATDPTPPSTTTHRLLELGLLTLPRGAVRQRYRQEFTADLYAVPRRQQFRLALAFVIHMRSLRAAFVGTLDPGVELTPDRRSFRCRINVHRYHMVSNSDGERYQCCVRCGKVYPGGGGTNGLWMAGSQNPV